MKAKALLKVTALALSLSLLTWHPESGAQVPKAKPYFKGAAFARPEIKRPPRSTFRVDVRLVLVRAGVVDSMNRYVAGLEQEHFRLFEDKVEQKVVHFAQEIGPLSVGIIFDISGSMRAHFAAAKRSIVQFLEGRNEEDEFFLISFNHKVTLDADFTNQAANVQNLVSFRSPEGRTALYDAVYMGLSKMHEARHGRKALIVITDGEDNSSRYSFKEVKDLAKESDVPIYVIGQEGSLNYGKAIIEDLVRLTGGRSFFPYSFDRLEYYIQTIHSELRHQYVLGYYSTNPDLDGKWRRIKVKLDIQKGLYKLAVNTRSGYYALKR